MDQKRSKERTLLDTQDVERTLQRLAHEMWETHGRDGDLALVGIRTRGFYLAERLGKMISALRGAEVQVGALDIGLYRDDLELQGVAPMVRSTEIHFTVDRRPITLIDDVLFTGRTVRSALNALCDLGRPSRVRLAVLIDRGHRELPIRADYVGKNMPSARHEEIQVRLVETDGIDEVDIISSANPLGSESRKIGHFQRSS